MARLHGVDEQRKARILCLHRRDETFEEIGKAPLCAVGALRKLLVQRKCASQLGVDLVDGARRGAAAGTHRCDGLTERLDFLRKRDERSFDGGGLGIGRYH